MGIGIGDTLPVTASLPEDAEPTNPQCFRRRAVVGFRECFQQEVCEVKLFHNIFLTTCFVINLRCWVSWISEKSYIEK